MEFKAATLQVLNKRASRKLVGEVLDCFLKEADSETIVPIDEKIDLSFLAVGETYKIVGESKKKYYLNVYERVK